MPPKLGHWPFPADHFQQPKIIHTAQSLHIRISGACSRQYLGYEHECDLVCDAENIELHFQFGGDMCQKRGRKVGERG